MFGRKLHPAFTIPGMFTISQEVRDVLAGARDEAARLWHTQVSPQHILLAAASDPRGAAILGRLGVTAEALRAHAERPGADRGPARSGGDPSGAIPYNSRAKRVLELAMASARARKSRVVEMADLLAAIVHEGKSPAALLLADMGVTVERLRDTLRGPDGTHDAAGAPAHGLRIDDASDVSIYEQLVSQVREGVATGRLRPGERLPSVRALADELDIAPGTVARAYAELERLAVVVTEGARGTRIAEPPAAPRSEAARPENLAGLLRPVVVAAFHLGATAADLRDALERAMTGILDGGEEDAGSARDSS